MAIAGGVLRRSDAVGALGVAVLVTAHAAFEPTGQSPTAVDFGLLTAASLALVAARRLPRLVVAFSAGCVFVYLSRVGQDVISVVPVLVAIYAAVKAGHRVVAPLASVPFIAAAFANASSPSEGILPVGWFLAAVGLGELHRQWEARVHEATERAAEAERTRDEIALRRAGEERLRIARELHDSLTHSISVIKVQADVAVHLARKRGDDVPDSLLAIQDASRDATRELRSTLDVLRSDDTPPGSGLAQLPELVERARSAGVAAAVTVAGERQPLPADVDRAAYRIVQESLTNVARHAGTETARVHVSYAGDELVICVDDDGRARPDGAPVPGVGLIGMRERVAALGGCLEAGPKDGGGFRVRATLPISGERS